jgi:hypothetical protein
VLGRDIELLSCTFVVGIDRRSCRHGVTHIDAVGGAFQGSPLVGFRARGDLRGGAAHRRCGAGAPLRAQLRIVGNLQGNVHASTIGGEHKGAVARAMRFS